MEEAFCYLILMSVTSMTVGTVLGQGNLNRFEVGLSYGEGERARRRAFTNLQLDVSYSNLCCGQLVEVRQLPI